MDVLLISPKFQNKNFLGIKFKFPVPLSLITLATYLKEEGYNPEIIDMNVEEKIEKKIKKIAREKEPLFIGISSRMITQLPFALRISEIVKAENPNTKIVWGGPFIDGVGIEAVKDPRVDIVVNGEGEETLHQLARAIEKNTNLRKVDGITYKKGNKIIRNKDRKFLDMNKLPFVDYSFLKRNIGYYNLFFGFETSRGCPYRCAYCDIPRFQRFKWRQKSASRAVDELEYLKNKWHNNLGVERYYICDPNPWLTDKRLEDFCNEIIERKIDVNLQSNEHMNFVNNKRLSMMEKAGFYELFFGIESGSERILKMLNKESQINKIVTRVKLLNKYDITPDLGFILGLPREKESDVYKTLNLMDKLKEVCPKSNILLTLFCPLPKTLLYEILEKDGIKLPKTLDDFAKFEYISRIDEKVINIYYYAHLIFSANSLYDFNDKIRYGLFNILKKFLILKYKKRSFEPSFETKILNLVFSRYRI